MDLQHREHLVYEEKQTVSDLVAALLERGVTDRAILDAVDLALFEQTKETE